MTAGRAHVFKAIHSIVLAAVFAYLGWGLPPSARNLAFVIVGCVGFLIRDFAAHIDSALSCVLTDEQTDLAVVQAIHDALVKQQESANG